MGLLDRMAARPPKSLSGTNKSFIDADTLQDDEGNRFRLQGIDAGEVEKVIDGKYKLGTAGGAETTDVIRGLANEQGFTNVVPQFDEKGQPVYDRFGRIISDLTNDKGESFRTKLLEAGAFDVNKYTTQQDIAARDIAEARRNRDTLSGDYTENAFDIAAQQIEDAELADGAKTLGFKRTALNEAELAAAKAAGLGHIYQQDSVAIRSFDRNLNNESLNPFTDSFEQGIINVGAAAAGVLNLIGEETGSESIAQWGDDMIQRQEAKLGEYGTTLLNYKDVVERDTNGDLKVWETVDNTFEFLGNNLALSIPYMGATAIGAAAAPFTYGTSFALPVGIYTGDVWNEMEGEKNAAVAVGAGVLQATLDKFGLTKLAGSGKASSGVMKDAVNALVKRGIPKEAAEQQLLAATRKEIANLAGVAQDVAKRQLAAKAVVGDILKRGLVAGGFEGATEVGQEAIGYLAATQGSDKTFNWEELQERLVSAAVAGSALGGAIAAPGGVTNALAWADVYGKGSTDIAEKASLGEVYANWEKEKYGYIASTNEIVADAATRFKENPGATINERTEEFKATNKKSWFKDLIDNPAQYWQGAARNIFTPDLQAQSRAARKLADVFGANLQRTFHGSNFENSKHHRVSVLKNMVSSPENFYKAIGVKSYPGSSLVHAFSGAKQAASDGVYKMLNAAVDKDGKFNPELIPADAKGRDAVITLGNELNQLADRMLADQRKYNPELGRIDNYLFKFKTISAKAVKGKQEQFRQLLQDEYGLDINEAKRITDEIVDNPEVNDIDEAFSVVRGGISPSSHKKRSLALSENEKFQDFMERDLFANVSKAVKSAARYTAHREFIGENGAVVSKLLDDMQAEGVPKDQVNKVAAQLQNYLDAESGNYKRPTTDFGKKLQRVQKNVMMFTTLSGLPLAVVSSFVELALSTQALRKDQIFGKKGGLAAIGQTAANNLWDGADKTLREKDYKARRPSEILQDLGYYDWDVGAATTTGVTEINSWQQPLYETFFKANGLQGWTNYTRSIRASIAGDYMFDKAQTIGDARLSGEPTTREVQEAEEALRNLGIDVDQFTAVSQKKASNIPLTEQEQTFLDDTMREATFNFINNAVALPQSGNRPLIYQDPRFALFTQFQGFIATFTANHIPRLWGDYVKRGTPAMKYNAFATMATMIMLGFAAQGIKDYIKYAMIPDEDEEFKTGQNPYLDNPEYLQRGLRASGLLGTGERVLDLFFPIYEQRSKGVGDWAWNQVSGESPAISYLERLARGTGKVAEGDVEAGIYQGLKSAPVLGPFTNLNKVIASNFQGWNFKGE